MSAGAQGVDSGATYVWDVPGKPVEIRLDLDVVERISQDVLRGFSALPKRGAEVGGILLGELLADGNRTVVVIRDAETVPIEYKYGPSYLLSGGDAEAFDLACAKYESEESPVRPVGFFRSHTREGLSPAPEDLDLCANFFPDPSEVLLLIRPHATKPSVAGFFFYENGRFARNTYKEFPFRRRDLGGTEPDAARPLSGFRKVQIPPRPSPAEAIHRPPLSPASSHPDWPEPPQQPRRSETTWYPEADPDPRDTVAADPGTPAASSRRVPARPNWIPLLVAFLLAGMLLGFWSANVWRPRAASPTLALGLAMAESGGNLTIRWNANAPAIKASRKGLLEIRDGQFQKSVELDGSQLRTGSIIYRYAAKDIKARMEVYPADRVVVAESASWSAR